MTNVITERNFKELEIILSSFDCDKHCPYCTAKITKWESVQDNIYKLGMYVGQLKKLGYTFHYVTIGGNGEPTLHSYDKLKEIVEMFDDYDIPVKRVLTSGNVFRDSEKDKYELFVQHGWLFEVTTTNINIDKDMGVLGYNIRYFETERFKKAKIRLNYVLLKENVDTLAKDVVDFLNKYDNIVTLALKLLNVNTRTNEADNSISKWIVDNAVPKTDREIIKDILDKNFEYNGEMYDTFSWKVNDKEVYFSWKKATYGMYDLVYYGDRFVNYQLEEQKLEGIVPMVYIASKFNKKKIGNKSSFEDDFRVKLIGSEDKFVNYNSDSFLKSLDNQIVYQYLGPFWNEKASSGILTSTDCDEVVSTENKLIEACDEFWVYFDENLSPGSIVELMYAIYLDKKITIFYKKEDNSRYEVKSSNWYPIVATRQFMNSSKNKPKVIEIVDDTDITKNYA